MHPVCLTCAVLLFIALVQMSCTSPAPQAPQSGENAGGTVSPSPNPADTTSGDPHLYINDCQRTLFTAMWDGDAKVVQCYMDAGADPNTPSNFDHRPGDHNGETILVDAVRHGYVEAASVLVWAGADVNTIALLPKWDPEHGVDPTSWEPSQPLIFLALPPQPSERHFQILRVLLAARADANAKLNQMPGPEHHASRGRGQSLGLRIHEAAPPPSRRPRRTPRWQLDAAVGRRVGRRCGENHHSSWGRRRPSCYEFVV